MGVDIVAKGKQAALTSAQARNAGETLQQAFDRFLALEARRPSTVTDYRFLWRLHIPDRLKHKPVKHVTAEDIESAAAALGKRARTANKVLVLMSAIMAKSGRCADNPARGLPRHQERIRTRRLSVDELQRVWSAIVNEPEWGDFFRLLILTGSRRSPFCAMRFAHRRKQRPQGRPDCEPLARALAKRSHSQPPGHGAGCGDERLDSRRLFQPRTGQCRRRRRVACRQRRRAASEGRLAETAAQGVSWDRAGVRRGPQQQRLSPLALSRQNCEPTVTGG